MSSTVVVSAHNVAGFPEGAGHMWVYLQYVLGLRQLGCDVYWLEAFRTRGHASRRTEALATFRERMRRRGLGGRVLLYRDRAGRPARDAPTEYLGVAREEAEAIFERADLLLNFHYAIGPGLLARFRRTALVDIDPGLLQLWIARRQLRVPRHDRYFTIAERVPEALPDGRPWIPIRPAVSLADWPPMQGAGSGAFTTVSIWDSSDWVVDGEDRYENTKRAAFLEFSDLPRLTDQPLELALYLRTERDMADRRELEKRGWRVRLSHDVAGTPESYREYIQGSRGEFSCAKPSYVRLRTAWVSDRTVCYLASARPVVVQDTGPSAYLPNGEGMFRVSAPSQAASAIARINVDYAHHCRAARRLAEEQFDARKVLLRILNEAIR